MGISPFHPSISRNSTLRMDMTGSCSHLLPWVLADDGDKVGIANVLVVDDVAHHCTLQPSNVLS